jgi:lactoylglutathione lyase
MAIKKFEHVGIMVKDLDISQDFYQNILGLDLLDRYHANPEVELAFLGEKKTGQVYVELISEKNDDFSDDGKVNHLAFTVDNIEEEVERLKSLEVPFYTDDILELNGKSRYIFFKGPDGEKLELFQP